MWWVYLVRCGDHTLYCGTARNVERRVIQHNSGRGARYTSTRRPVTLVYQEAWVTRGLALQREAAIKRWTRTQKDALIRPLLDGG